jgi:hypothetical protein
LIVLIVRRFLWTVGGDLIEPIDDFAVTAILFNQTSNTVGARMGIQEAPSVMGAAF